MKLDGFVLRSLLVVASLAMQAFTIATLWEWFAPPPWVPFLPISRAVGVVLLEITFTTAALGSISIRLPPKPDRFKSWMAPFVMCSFVYPSILAVGWLCKEVLF